jgi:hypothetical protein
MPNAPEVNDLMHGSSAEAIAFRFPRGWEQLVEDLRFRLVQLLAPFGWKVAGGPRSRFEYCPGDGYSLPMVGATFVVKIEIREKESVACGMSFENTLELWTRDLADRAMAERKVEQFARATMLGMMNELPREIEARPIDWRPSEAIPEDFHAG